MHQNMHQILGHRHPTLSPETRPGCGSGKSLPGQDGLRCNFGGDPLVPSTTVVDSAILSLLCQWFSGLRDGEAIIGLEA